MGEKERWMNEDGFSSHRHQPKAAEKGGDALERTGRGELADNTTPVDVSGGRKERRA
jgi:hypothetical protein